MPKLRYLYPNYNQTGTKTFRWTSSRPNVQNLKGDKGAGGLRHLFIPEPGNVIVSGDWSQIELTIAAYASGEQKLIDAIEAHRADKKLDDGHQATARLMFNIPVGQGVPESQRKICKNCNFATIYGSGADTLVATLARDGFPVSFPQADGFLKSHHKMYPRLWHWSDTVKREADRTGWVETLYGSWLKIDRWRVETVAVNYVVQGTASQLAERSLVKWHAYLKEQGIAVSEEDRAACAPWDLFAKIWLYVHDEFNTEVPAYFPLEHLRAKKRVMEDSGLWFKTPVEFSVCPRNWAEKVKLHLEDFNEPTLERFAA